LKLAHGVPPLYRQGLIIFYLLQYLPILVHLLLLKMKFWIHIIGSFDSVYIVATT
jgi:hypothetical protein